MDELDVLITNGNLILPGGISKLSLGIKKGKIVYLGRGKIKAKKEIDAKGNFVSAGLIDIHCHGMGGCLFEDETEKAFEKISKTASIFGTTTMLATLTASKMEKRVQKTVQLIKKTKGKKCGAQIVGIYLEGPFINPSERGNLILGEKPSLKTLDKIIKLASGLPLIMTIAPEITFGIDAIVKLKNKKIVPSIGHSEATYDEAKRGIEIGIESATHLFNAMRGHHHREPGVVGAVFDSENVTAELILDGHHMHPASARLANKVLGIERLIFITDSTSAAGTDNVYTRVYDGQEAVVKDGSPLIGNRLAGSILTLNQAVKNFIDWTGVSIEKAILPATINPAKKIGMQDRKGTIEVGKDADIIIFDKNIRIEKTIINGLECR
jgi:N-acetylglucosamine-6-phosphate deacetylase